MEVIERVGDFFTAATGKIERGITSIFGSSNENRIKKIGFVRDKHGNTTITPGSLIDRINSFEPAWQAKSDDELMQTTAMFRERLRAGETLDDLMPEAFAAVRESGRRFLQMRHYDVQMVGGWILHNGMIAEMVTGEGKTLVATLPTYLNAIAGHVHVVTVNDYLARRDMEWMGPIHMKLGLTIGAIQSEMGPQERQQHYSRDITYGTSNQFGFDYLRDNMKPTRDLQVQGPLDYAIVDEIDNILIDEARTPLIISGPAHDNLEKYPKADTVARQLRAGVDFEVKEKEHTCHLTEEGTRKAEELAGVDSFYTAGNMEWPHLIDNSLKAHHLYKKDIHYVVEHGEVIIVDENTGRKMEGRQWSDGLHQAVEAKEHLKIKEESQTLATITLQNYFKLYNKLAGMTGTAMTEAEEFYKIYNLDVMAVPTNRTMQRINFPDNIYGSDKEKWGAVVEEIKEVHQTGRPILVGTTSIETSELVANKLTKQGIKHDVLNAKQHEREAEIVAQAGRRGAVTIATNMAGRGTDIILGGNPEHAAWEELKVKYPTRLEVPKSEWDELTDQIAERDGMKAEAKEIQELGGLHVIGTERHDSRRIDLQLRGRAGRQGDPGSSRFFISLDDKLMRLFAGDFVKRVMQWAGLENGEPIVSPMVTRRVEGAQKKIEERHFDQRKNLLEYDEIMDEQRKRTYAYRQQILDGADCRELLLGMMDSQISQWVPHFLNNNYRENSLAEWASQKLHLDLDAHQFRGFDRDQLEDFLKDEAERQYEAIIYEQTEVNLPEADGDEEEVAAIKREWNWIAMSRWANQFFGLNLNDRDLQKVGRDEVPMHLLNLARGTIQRWDVKDLDTFMDPDFEYKSLCGWANHHFTLNVNVDEVKGKEDPEIEMFLKDQVRNLYDEKEVTFPVKVGLSSFLSGDGAHGEKYNREKLCRWANTRFRRDFSPEQFASMSTPQIEELLIATSRDFLLTKPDVSAVEAKLLELLPDSDIDAVRVTEEQAKAVAAWADGDIKWTVDQEKLLKMKPAEARASFLQGIEATYRPELRQTERSVLLEIVDTAWKDHLYYMGHLKQGIGFVGYAQKDPKTEYKREGRKAFNAMWDRVAEQVTQATFRIEQESPAFVGSLWRVTATEHDVAPPVDDPTDNTQTSGSEPGEGNKAIDPIINDQPKVGRNDPCPCGSGKKYKKCHGK
ncbi:preprotein translocase subunit SecA [Fuerstiella marisgermanici]|uniref:Protein translocase subunit SecA n=1 Tax=Fuerstiella marisgermanici TaxID=1891926 RepID=A0A1P8WE59_9PLAN|nr:preprotein translocase subunit SecA [Fuerstiella marisgermanici]APZ92353.1 preprotein translocase subunit [Fuerstiella marisgermanici]